MPKTKGSWPRVSRVREALGTCVRTQSRDLQDALKIKKMFYDEDFLGKLVKIQNKPEYTNVVPWARLVCSDKRPWLPAIGFLGLLVSWNQGENHFCDTHGFSPLLEGRLWEAFFFGGVGGLGRKP